MTYSAFESGAEGSRPAEVFEFTTGAVVLRYTSSESIETIGVATYLPVAMQRSSTAGGPETSDHDLTIELPASDALAQQFAGLLSGERTRVVIKRFQRDDGATPEVIVVFDGFIHGVTFSDDLRVCRLTSRSSMSSLGRQTPSRTFQSLCGHVLYNEDTCRVDDTNSAFRASAKSPTGQVGSVLSVAGLGAYAAGWFTGGYVEQIITGIKRQILEDDGAGNLTLLVPFVGVPTSVNVLAGCDHSGATCHEKFGNLINLGAFPFVPTKNPFTSGLQ